MHWHRISARIGGSVESNKSFMTRREFVKWAEFFDWEDRRRNKEENYLARIVFLLERQVFKDPAEMKDCFCPPLSDEEMKMTESEKEEGMLDPETGWAALASVFGKKE